MKEHTDIKQEGAEVAAEDMEVVSRRKKGSRNTTIIITT